MFGRKNVKAQLGFTLIEVMLVILVVGVMVSVVQNNFTSNKSEEVLKEESARFAGIFDIASEYSMLNNIEIGVVIESESYQFVGYDGVSWVEIPEQDALTKIDLPEGVVIALELEDLPIEEPLFFDAESIKFEDPEEDEFSLESDKEKAKKIIPQIYILSGGDITPFSLTFYFEEALAVEDDLAFKVTGLYNTPLLIEGPYIDE